MNAKIFCDNEFLTYGDSCFYIDSHWTLWKVTPSHDENNAPLIITKVMIFSTSMMEGHPPYYQDVLKVIKDFYK